MTTRTALAALAVLLAAAARDGAAQAPADAVEAELKRLAGEWQVVAAEQDGMPVGSMSVARFGEGKLTLTEPGAGLPPVELALALDPTKTPPWLDVTNRGGRTQKGVYELKGDKLKVISQADPSGPRPAAFKTAKGDGLVMYTYERVKKK